MPVSTSRRVVTIALTGFSGLSALAAVGVLEQLTDAWGQSLPYPLDELMLAWLLIVGVLAIWATVAYAHGRHLIAQRVLLVVGFMGLIPAVLPGVFALAARTRVLRER
ncbi:hypothetical protein [Micromonospora sp. HK10]|uniref:hypothetical protein n=1 Tax=Micromonospora sp. HK10 TaxID=1538294 RepID=UPI0012E2E8A4|nr:hypothetical protein [Micromonospora sp. HK10]